MKFVFLKEQFFNFIVEDNLAHNSFIIYTTNNSNNNANTNRGAFNIAVDNIEKQLVDLGLNKDIVKNECYRNKQQFLDYVFTSEEVDNDNIRVTLDTMISKIVDDVLNSFPNFNTIQASLTKSKKDNVIERLMNINIHKNIVSSLLNCLNNPERLRMISSDNSISSINSDNINTIPMHILNGLTKVNIKLFSNDVWSKINSSHFNHIHEDAINGINSTILNLLSHNVLSNMVPNLFIKLPSESFKGLTLNQFKNIKHFNLINSIKLSKIDPTFFLHLDKEKMKQLPDNSIGGLTKDQLKNIPNKSFINFSGEKIRHCNVDVFKYISSNQFNQIPLDSMKSIDSDNLKNMNIDILLTLDIKRLNNIPSKSFENIGNSIFIKLGSVNKTLVDSAELDRINLINIFEDKVKTIPYSDDFVFNAEYKIKDYINGYNNDFIENYYREEGSNVILVGYVQYYTVGTDTMKKIVEIINNVERVLSDVKISSNDILNNRE